LTGGGRDATLAAARTPENAEDCGRVAAGRVERRRRPETAPAEPRGFPGQKGGRCPMSGRAMERLARGGGPGTQGSVGKRKAAGLALALAGFLAALFPDACRAARPDIVWMAGGHAAWSGRSRFPLTGRRWPRGALTTPSSSGASRTGRSCARSPGIPALSTPSPSRRTVRRWPRGAGTAPSGSGASRTGRSCARSPGIPTMSTPSPSRRTVRRWPRGAVTGPSGSGASRTGRSCARSPGIPAMSSSVAFSPDGQTLASGGLGQHHQALARLGRDAPAHAHRAYRRLSTPSPSRRTVRRWPRGAVTTPSGSGASRTGRSCARSPGIPTMSTPSPSRRTVRRWPRGAGTTPSGSGASRTGRSCARSPGIPTMSPPSPSRRTVRRWPRGAGTTPSGSGASRTGRSCARSPGIPAVSTPSPSRRTVRRWPRGAGTTPSGSGASRTGRSCARSPGIPAVSLRRLLAGRSDAGLGELGLHHQALARLGRDAPAHAHRAYLPCLLRRLLAGRSDAGLGELGHTIRLWRVSDGTLLRTLTGHTGVSTPSPSRRTVRRWPRGAGTTPSGSGASRTGRSCARSPGIPLCLLRRLLAGRPDAGLGER
jgi:hypothetical protein